MCKCSLWVVNCAPRGCAKKNSDVAIIFSLGSRCLPGYCKSSVMICKKPGQPGIQPCKKRKKKEKHTSLKPRQGLVQRGCLCRSTELVTLLRQQGRSPAGVGEGMRAGRGWGLGGGEGLEAGGVVWLSERSRVDARPWGICFSPHHLTEKLTSGHNKLSISTIDGVAAGNS